jgi:hypothetical protein
LTRQSGWQSLHGRIPRRCARSGLEKINHFFLSGRLTALQVGRQKIWDVQLP